MPLYYALNSDVGLALIKAQNLERQAETYLFQRCLQRIEAKGQFYKHVDPGTRKLPKPNVDVGIARGIHHLAEMVTKTVREYLTMDSQDGSESSASELSEPDQDLDI